MKKLLCITTVMLTAVTASVSADEVERRYPGSSWGSIATNPFENNVITTLHAEQGIVAVDDGPIRLIPFVDGTVSWDSLGYDWNRKATARAGVMLGEQLENGIFALRAGHAWQWGLENDQYDHAWFVNAEYWTGWNLDDSEDQAYPGSSWGSLGIVTPSEPDNMTLTLHADQGFLAHNFGGGRMVPFIGDTFSIDSEGYDWNNKNQIMAGIQYQHPLTLGTASAGVQYIHEYRFITDTQAHGVSLFATYYLGW